MHCCTQHLSSHRPKAVHSPLRTPDSGLRISGQCLCLVTKVPLWSPVYAQYFVCSFQESVSAILCKFLWQKLYWPASQSFKSSQFLSSVKEVQEVLPQKVLKFFKASQSSIVTEWPDIRHSPESLNSTLKKSGCKVIYLLVFSRNYKVFRYLSPVNTILNILAFQQKKGYSNVFLIPLHVLLGEYTIYCPSSSFLLHV